MLRLLLLVALVGVATSRSLLRPPLSLYDAPIPAPADDVDYRLPITSRPLRYNIKLVPYIVEGNFTFDGEVEITFQEFDREKITIVLHANKLNIQNDSVTVRDVLSGSEVGVKSLGEDPKRQFLFINLQEKLTMSATYKITIKYTGILDDDMDGFYRSSYVENGVRRWLATTQFESGSARRAFPCFDEPALKANFTLHISRTADMRSFANMPQDGEPEPDTEHTGEPRYWDHFKETPRMSTYLLAFLVSDFVALENPVEKHRIFVQPKLVGQASYALQLSPPILNWLANFTGIPFALPKMDEVAVPDFSAGAMENWGFVTYRERLLLVEDGQTTAADRQSVATVIAHEYAHQWFGDLVTPRWWTYLWLSEGFATYFMATSTAALQPTWRMDEQFVTGDFLEAMDVDAVQSSHPMSNEVNSPASISLMFDSISYSKGGSVIRMMENILTTETFRRGLNRYLTKNAYDAASADQLFDSLDEQWHLDNSEVADLSFVTIMQTWTLQMGFPVVNVTWESNTEWITMSQERFLLSRSENVTDDHTYRWDIPLTYTSQSELNFNNTQPRLWFMANSRDKQNSLKIKPLAKDEWIIFNIKASGFYRVNYDARNWERLIAHLKGPNYQDIPALNRVLLIDDSFNLARAGYLAYSTPLALSQYLDKEVDYIVWNGAFQSLGFIDRKISNAPEYTVFQKFLLDLVETLYTTVGFEGAEDGDDHVTLLNRAQAVSWACALGETACVQKSKDSLQRWMDSPTVNPVKPDVRSTVYCTSLKNGGQTEWDFMWNQYLTTTVAGESALIIGALGCSTDPETLRRYLEVAVEDNSPIRKQDAAAVFAAVYNHPEGVDVALDFLIEDFEHISEYFGGLNSLGSLLINIANKCNTQEQADKLKQFLAENEVALGGAADSAQRAIEIVEENLKWQLTFGQEIIDWIKANTKSGR